MNLLFKSIGRQLVCLCLLSLCMSCSNSSMTSSPPGVLGEFDVRRFGAVGDGQHLDSPAINAAIQACAKAGGGTVAFPRGTYLSGSIHLMSHINLYLDSGATLLGAPQELKAYDAEEIFDGHTYQDEGHTFFHNSLIWGEGLTNISVTGRGTINGGGLLAHTGGNVGNKSIALKSCKDILLRDITIMHGGWFAILATGCDQMTIDNLTIDTNRDGMDIDCCRNVMVLNCRVNSPIDDGICPKSTLALGWPVVTENVTITNCQVYGYREGSLLDGSWQLWHEKGGTGRIKMGTESSGGFRNITISNCTFSHCRGLALEEVDGGILENISISNITMTDVANSPIFIRLGARNRGPADYTETGEIKNISISNMIATGIQKQGGIEILGMPDHDIEGVRLENIRMSFNGGGNAVDAGRMPLEWEQDYPEPTRFGTMPAYGLYARHVKDLELSNIRFDFKKKDLRPALACLNINGLLIDDLTAKVSKGIVPGWLYKVKHLVIRNSPLLVHLPTTQPSTRPATMPATEATTLPLD